MKASSLTSLCLLSTLYTDIYCTDKSTLWRRSDYSSFLLNAQEKSEYMPMCMTDNDNELVSQANK